MVNPVCSDDPASLATKESGVLPESPVFEASRVIKEKKVSPDSMPSSVWPVKAVSVVCRVCLDSLVLLVRMDCWVHLELRDRVVSPEFPEYPEFPVNPVSMVNLENLVQWVYLVYLVLILKRVNRVFLDCPEDMDNPEELARKERRVTTVQMDLRAFLVCLAYRSRVKRV